jgi:hypothetical protein
VRLQKFQIDICRRVVRTTQHLYRSVFISSVYGVVLVRTETKHASQSIKLQLATWLKELVVLVPPIQMAMMQSMNRDTLVVIGRLKLLVEISEIRVIVILNASW